MENAITIVNIIAIILSPILAVAITQRLQDRAKKREDKLSIFKILMANRHYGWAGRDSVYALNIIDIAFSDSTKVREQWALYHEYMSRPPENISANTANIKRTELLEAMAEGLGYKGKVTWVTVQNSYMPKGYNDYLDNEARYYEAQSKMANLVDMLINMLNSPTIGKDIIKSLLTDFGTVHSDLLSNIFANIPYSTDGKNAEEPTTETTTEREETVKE